MITALSIRAPSAIRARVHRRSSGCHQASASGTTTSAPAVSPSHHGAGEDRDEEAADAGHAVEWTSATDELANQICRDDDLECVAYRLTDRSADRKRVVLVCEQIADDHPRPQAHAPEI
jgi:hypothetical protein